MILDSHNAQQANLPRPFDTPPRAAYILDKNQEPYRVYQGRNVRTALILRYNHWRPCYELNMKLSPRSRIREIDRALESLSISDTGQEATDKNDEKEVQVAFTKGIFIRSCTRQECACETESLHQPKCFEGLPEATKTMMSKMSEPMLLSFAGGIEEILTINLALNYPKFAEEVRGKVFSDRSVTVLTDAGGYTSYFNKLKACVQEDKEPLELFCPRGLGASGRFELSRFIANPMPQDVLGFHVSSVFKSGNEFIVNGLARAELDRAPEVRQIKRYEQSPKTLILADVRGEKLSRDYEGLVNRPRGGQYALQPGDRIAIQFEDSEWNSREVSWRATVMRTKSLAREDMLSVLVHRGQDEDSREYSKFQPRAIIAKNMSETELLRSLRSNTGNDVRVKIVDCESTFTNIRAAYMNLDTPVSKAADPFRARIRSILLGRRPDRLTSKDLYHHIRTEDFDPRKYMTPLNSRQLDVVEAARSMRGGMQFTQGPPGTGKTYTLLQQAAPFLAAKVFNMILLAAPTNHGADDLTQGMGKIVAGLKEMHPHVKTRNPYVLRAYPEKVEEEIFRTQGRRFVVPPSEVAKTVEAISPPPTERTDSHKRMDEYRAADEPKFDGVHDKRVTDIEFSIGYMKLLICGVIPSSEHACPDPEAFAAFRELYKKRAQGHKLSTAERVAWESESNKLTELAVQALLGYVKDKVVAAFMDEAAFEREDSLMPLFAAHFTLDPCFVMIGDQQQLAPLAMASKEENAFRPQVELSFMTRMINIGWEYTMLTEQHRMVPEISAIANSLTYQGKLINDPSTQLSDRPLAQKFRNFTEKHYGVAANRLMIDLPPGKTNKVTRNDKSSKCNDFSICVVAELVRTLLKKFGSKADIGILTPYKGQRLSYERMEAMMRKSELKNFDMVTIDTLDGAQGRQFDIVILDLVVGSSAGFLESENRLNVAMTRAKDGFIIVCDRCAIDSAYYKNWGSAPYMKRMVRLFNQQTWTRPEDDEYPKTKFYTPANAKSTWVGSGDYSSSDSGED